MTALQELIKLIYVNCDEVDLDVEPLTVGDIYSAAKKLLEKERIQIQDAFDVGQANWDENCRDIETGVEYYKFNYGLEKHN